MYNGKIQHDNQFEGCWWSNWFHEVRLKKWKYYEKNISSKHRSSTLQTLLMASKAVTEKTSTEATRGNEISTGWHLNSPDQISTRIKKIMNILKASPARYCSAKWQREKHGGVTLRYKWRPDFRCFNVFLDRRVIIRHAQSDLTEHSLWESRLGFSSNKIDRRGALVQARFSSDFFYRHIFLRRVAPRWHWHIIATIKWIS